MIQNQQFSMPAYLESMSVNNYESQQSNRKTILNQNALRQRNATVNISTSFHQDLLTNESEGDLLLNYSDIQQHILKDSKTRSRNHTEIRQSALNLSEVNPHAQSKYLTRAFYSKQRVLKYQNKNNETTQISSTTPQKQSNLNISADAIANQQRQTIRRTATASHPQDIKFIINRDEFCSSRGKFLTNYSLNRIKSSMKISRDNQKQKTNTNNDSFVLEGRHAGNNKSFLDQSIMQSEQLSNSTYFEKDFGKKKKVIYSRKSILQQANEDKSTVEQQNFQEQNIYQKNGQMNKNKEILTQQVDNQNIQESQNYSPRILGIDTPSFKQQQLSPIMVDNRHSKLRARKLMVSPYHKQNIKQRQDSQNNLQSNYQQNYLALFPLKDPKHSNSKINDNKIQINKQQHQLNTDQNNLHPINSKRINQKFEFLHMNSLNNEIVLSQAPSFQRNEILNQFYPKVFPAKKLKPIKIYEIY